MIDNTNGNNRSLVQAIRDNLHAASSRIFDVISNSFEWLQRPAPNFPHQQFSLAVSLILAYRQVTSQGKPVSDSNPALYFTAVTAFLAYCLVGGFEMVSSSHPACPLPESARFLLHRCMFLAGTLSFAATASFLFPDTVRAIMFASFFAIISAIYLLYCVYTFHVINTQGSAIPQ